MTAEGAIEALADVLEERGETEGVMWGSLELSRETYEALARAVIAAGWVGPEYHAETAELYGRASMGEAAERDRAERAERERAAGYARGRDEALAEVEMRLSDDGIDGTTVIRELREQEPE